MPGNVVEVDKINDAIEAIAVVNKASELDELAVANKAI